MQKYDPYQKRFIILYCVLGVLFFLLVGRLFTLQILEGAANREITQKRLVKTMTQKAPRGEILDRYGRPLVSNRMGYSIQVFKTAETNEELNEIIANLIAICKGEQADYYDGLPISKLPPYTFSYQADTEEALIKEIQRFNKSLRLNEELTASEAVEALAERYQVSEEYDIETAREIIGVRSDMELRLFSGKNPYIFASDVNMNIVTKVEESLSNMRGVNIITEYMREYNEPGTASHILGRIGPIYREEYETLKQSGYSISDVVGKDGIEKYSESVLKGKDGTYTIEQDADGHIVSRQTTSEAIPGNDVILTIDLELQKTADRILKETIEKIRADSRYAPNNEGHDADSGSVVVLDIHTGETLAIASAPTYDLSVFNETYAENYKNPAKPLWNRAISGTYEPGSTFKMITALAGLETGVVNKNTTIHCSGIYRYYARSNYTPYCWKRSGHGNMQVVSAIENSCNCYFYETGRLLTIDTLNDYTKQFGLGDYTGIELAGEAKGIVAGPEYVEKIGETWWPGDTIQAAIGQSKNLFTPVQLANYIATLANGGSRYQVHLVKKVKEYSTSKIISEATPSLVNTVDIRPENYQLVKTGMAKVTEDGTASNVFRNFEVAVGGKTGTSEVSKGSNNGVFVAFAPFDNPQIAISVVVEHGSHGNSIAPVARELIRQYLTGDFLEYNDYRRVMEIAR